METVRLLWEFGFGEDGLSQRSADCPEHGLEALNSRRRDFDIKSNSDWILTHEKC